MNPSTVYTLWLISIVVLLVVTAVVALLLSLVLGTAKRINTAVSEIWISGQGVANNTVHIPLLAATNHYAGQILETAKRIVGGAAAIEQHAAGCPGCPMCTLAK